MAKKKEVESCDVDAGMAAIKKKYGNIVQSGIELFDEKRNLKCLSVSPAFDIALNGGILEGSWTVISGNPKCGKSSCSLRIVANGQKEGRRGIWVDAENRLQKHNLTGTDGLDMNMIDIIRSSEDNALSAEDFLSTVDSMIRMPKNKGCVCVIDSTSSMLPRAELDADISGTLRANMPKLLSHWIKKNAQVVSNNKIIMILITHYITNTSGYGKSKLPDGGVMIQYQADNRIDFLRTEPWEENGKKIGQMAECEISCSAMGASGNKLSTYIRYGHGIDFTKETIELGESFGLIEKAGSWFTLPFLSEDPHLAQYADQKFQGKHNLYEFIKGDQRISDFLNKELALLLST